MPTGYTSDIYEGKNVTGKEFLMICARAFGIYEPFDAEIPEEFQPNDYHLRRLEEVKNELERYRTMTIEEAKIITEREYEENIKYNKEQHEIYKNLKERYLNVLSDVLQWQPPTEDHVELKNFAIKQLENSIKFDCDGKEKFYPLDVEKETPEEYIKRNIDSCLRNITYHSEEYKKEVKKTLSRNKWIKELRESLK